MAQFEGSLSDQVSTPLVHDTEQSWTSRALDSFLNAGKEAVIDHPVQTSGSLVAGFVIGDGVQRALTAAESMGGKIAMSAKVAELAFAVAPFVYMSHRIYTADDSAKEAGQAIFDTSLFVGTASLGRAWRFSKYEDAALQSGKITHPGLSLEDAPRAAALASSDTAMKNSTRSYFAGIYEKNHADGVVSKFLRNKTEIRTTASNDILAVRPNGDQVTFHENGMISALQGVGPGVKQWEFRPDQSFTMRQGNHTMRVGADGRGMSDFPQPGESELLRPGLGALQGKIFSLSDVNFDRVNGTAGGFKLPDVTPIPKTDVELLLGAKRQFALKEAGQAANYDVSSNVVPQSNSSTDTTGLRATLNCQTLPASIQR
ncbi:MAG: hypothetical protein JST89_06185 [Cyanobacteria bacterium SZAS-4]|nr:hypothetical protein [Cyanobacteria bacterium SZAS-4]